MSQPGWYVDPWNRNQIRFWDGYRWSPHTAVRHVPEGTALDQSMAVMRDEDARAWGWRPVVIPIVSMIAVIVATQFVVNLEPRTRTAELIFVAVVNLLVEGSIGLMLFLAGREVAARHGGWARAFGWSRPRWKDFPVAGVGFVVSFGLRAFIGVLLNLFSNGRAADQARNIEVHSINVPTVLLLVGVAVIAAPITEELMFRGLLLRTFMRKWSFWPSALLSTLIFGLFHTYEVDTVLGAVTLALSVGAMGLVNCVLVRRTDRLMPGMLVHAASNGLAVLVVLLTVHTAGFSS